MILKWMKRPAYILWAGCLLSACSTRLPVQGVRAFEQCQYSEASKIFEEQAKQGGKDIVLYELALLSSSLAAGDGESAEKAAVSALNVMFGQGGDARGTASLVSAESIKYFKGDPFEKSMAAIYAAIIFFNKGDYDNSRAALGKALLAIKQKQESRREDFALPYLLQSKLFAKMGDSDNARISLEKAVASAPSLSGVTVDQLKNSNAIFISEIGKGPRKIRTGPGASLAEWTRSRYPDQQSRIFVNQHELPKSIEVGDLTIQAQTKGRTGKDVVQGTKGVLREASVATTVIAADAAAHGNKKAGWVALGAGLFALANQSQADIRQWELLPDRFQVSFGQLREGANEIRAVFYDQFGQALPLYDQVWYDLNIKKGEDRIFLFRAGPCQKYIQGKPKGTS